MKKKFHPAFRIGRRLKSYRTFSLKLGVKTVARNAGISRKLLRQIENGDKRIKFIHVVDLIEHYQLDFRQFIQTV